MSLALKAARSRGMGPGNRGLIGRGRPMGDPGLFGFLGKVAKGVVGGAVGLVTGGPAGALAGVASPFVTPQAMPSIPLQQGSMPGVGTIVPSPGLGGTLARALPGGKTGYEVAGSVRGFHPNKSDYFLRDGTFVPKGSRLVKNRSRNPLNPRALRRAVARIDAGKTWQSKLHDIETAKFTKAGNKKACA
jgi:hypothetical protein